MTREKEAFLSRWSRLKREAPAAKPAEKKDDNAPQAPVLPPVEKLTPESDFTAFMQPKVADALRRVALKKLFSDPRFNIPDPFEAYSGDWTGGEPIPEEMLATLNQARTVLFPQSQESKPEQAQEQEEQKERSPEPQEKTAEDEPRRQDA
jgi:uncharacterized protein DUF3306